MLPILNYDIWLVSKSWLFSYTKYKSVAAQKVKILQYCLRSWTVDINNFKEEQTSRKAKFNKCGISIFTPQTKHPLHEHVMCTTENNDVWRSQHYKTDTAQWCNYSLPHQHTPLHTWVNSHKQSLAQFNQYLVLKLHLQIKFNHPHHSNKTLNS